MTSKISERTAPDGTTIVTRTWEPSGAPSATMVLVHGLAEHSGRYEHVGEAFATQGYRVHASDLRGFGRSGGRRAWVRRWDDYLDDLAVDLAAARARAIPVILLGHSLGGLVATSYALSSRPAPDLLVLSAPGLDADFPAYKKAMARVLGVVLPGVRVANGLKGHQLSRDPLVGEAYFADPLVESSTTLRLGREALVAGEQARARLDRLSVPALVIHGTHDPIVPPRISKPLESLPGVERLELDEHRHESFNEEGGRHAIAAVGSWIDRQLRAAQS